MFGQCALNGCWRVLAGVSWAIRKEAAQIGFEGF